MKSTLLLLLTMSASVQAWGWADTGHAIVGYIAEDQIKPQTKDFVRGVLGVEPLSVAAIFPDHVKDDQRFAHKESDPNKRAADNHDFGSYHFCEIPTGYNYDNRPNKAVKDCFGAITKSIELLKDTSERFSREEKMLALRYLVHVMGDVHMPLHVGNGFDLGGNACQIHWKEASNTVNLHAFWDDQMVQVLGQTYADPKATPARRAAIYAPDFVANMKRSHPEMFNEKAKQQAYQGELKTWLMETQALREGGLYPDDPEKMKSVAKGEEHKFRPYCAWYTDQDRNVLGEGSPQPGKIPSDAMPILTEEQYGRPNAKIVETQLMKAGLRLAATLDEIADAAIASGKSPALGGEMEEKILKSVQDMFRNK